MLNDCLMSSFCFIELPIARRVKKEIESTGLFAIVTELSADQKKQWANKLRSWRSSKGYSVKEAAFELGVRFDTYRHWEACQRVPNQFVQEAISKLMDEK